MSAGVGAALDPEWVDLGVRLLELAGWADRFEDDLLSTQVWWAGDGDWERVRAAIGGMPFGVWTEAGDELAELADLDDAEHGQVAEAARALRFEVHAMCRFHAAAVRLLDLSAGPDWSGRLLSARRVAAELFATDPLAEHDGHLLPGHELFGQVWELFDVYDPLDGAAPIPDPTPEQIHELAADVLAELAELPPVPGSLSAWVASVAGAA